jgi:UDP-N-acetyl-D-mannosaminuronic acid dehydrogenase
MRMAFERVSVVGLGYIGLPTAAVLANRGVPVVGVDVNARAVETINRGGVHIVEPGLDVLVRAAVNGGMLRAAVKPEPAQAFLIAVPTPFKEGHEPDLSYIDAAVSSIAPVLERGNLVLLESTSPVGTTQRIAALMAELRPDLTFPHDAGEAAHVQVAYCPERVLPGDVLRELVENHRVIGGLTKRCAQRAATLYRLFVQGECILTDARTAEMVKLTENAFRDVNIAFANELSLICDRLGINVWRLVELANKHPRVNILRPGPGVGGHCIPVDPWFIVHQAPREARLIRTAREVNDGKPLHVVEKVKEKAARFSRPRIACLGLSFKANVDDLRESPAVEIVHRLAHDRVGELLVVEPHVGALPQALRDFPHVRLVQLDEAIERADILTLLVDHEAFADVDRDLLKEKIVIDTRGLWR